MKLCPYVGDIMVYEHNYRDTMIVISDPFYRDGSSSIKMFVIKTDGKLVEVYADLRFWESWKILR